MARSTLIVVAAQLCAQRFVFEPGLGVRARRTDRDPEAFGERQEVGQADPVLAAAADLNRAELAGADPVADRSFCVPERFGDLADVERGPCSKPRSASARQIFRAIAGSV